MGKFLIVKTFRDGDKWYKQGDTAELTSEKAGKLINYQAIAPVLDTVGSVINSPKLETAEKKGGAETATAPTANRGGR